MKPARTILTFLGAVGAVLLTLPLFLLTPVFLLVNHLTGRIAGRLEGRVLPWSELIEFDADLGWKPRADLDARYLAEKDDVFRIRTDEEGWPGRAAFKEADVVIFGDSFAFGFGIDTADAFFERCRLPVKPVACLGFNMVQELLLMQRYADRLSGRLVVWFVYYGNDLYDNLTPSMRHYRMPFLGRKAKGDGEWRIVTSHVSPLPWTAGRGRRGSGIHLSVLSSLHSKTVLSERAYSVCDYLITEGLKVCEAAGARLAVFGIPSHLTLDDAGRRTLLKACPSPENFASDLPDRNIEEICRRLGIPFLRGRDFLTAVDYKGYYDHWNRKGHRKVAVHLESFVAEAKLLQVHPEKGERDFESPVRAGVEA